MSWLSRNGNPGPEPAPASTPPLRGLYRATSDGEVEGYLAEHGELVCTPVVDALENDLRLAVEYGDLDAACLAAEAAACVHALLGNPSESIARYLDLIQLHSSRAQTVQDCRDLRRSALVIGSMAQVANLRAELAECWLMVATADLRLSDLTREGEYPPREPLAHLLEALRDAADLGELLAEVPVQLRELSQLRGFVDLLGRVGERVGADWGAHETIVVRAVMRRLSHSCTRIVGTGQVVPAGDLDAEAVDWVASALRRLAVQFGS